MASLIRQRYTMPLPQDAGLITVDGVPCARFRLLKTKVAAPLTPGAKPVMGRKGQLLTAPLTADGQRVRLVSRHYYARVDGKKVKLFTDETASAQKLAELVRNGERGQTDLADPYEAHRRRPLGEHVADWERGLRRNTGKHHADNSLNCGQRIIAVCEFRIVCDLAATPVEKFLADLQADKPIYLDPTKRDYKKNELAAMLNMKPAAIPPFIKRHNLHATGNGKARRFPKATVEKLIALRTRGRSPKTIREYLVNFKAFCNWLVKDGRLEKSPVAHLSAGNDQNDLRHRRRFLDEQELGRIIARAQLSQATFDELTGLDRAMLYWVAAYTGLRASELAALVPADFTIAQRLIVLPGRYTKNGKDAEQPVPAPLMAALGDYLAGRAPNSPVWPGKWASVAAKMFRADLDAAGIPYQVESRHGPEFADFHSLRHSYVAMLKRSGATLEQAMRLARHGSAGLVMKIYGRARWQDLVGAVDHLEGLDVAW